MKKNPWVVIAGLVFVFGVLLVILMVSSSLSMFGSSPVRVTSGESILKLKLDGVIIDPSKFLKNLIKYRKDDQIKAIVIEVSSPGGVVGPSQEIYEEVKRVREEFKKPVVVVSTDLIASGAYYVAVAADKIVVQPGTLIGSIGVIMQFANLEGLYNWAKVSRFSISTGKFKDSGAEYRAMRDDEKDYFQALVNDTWVQFKEAVATGRNLKMEDVEPYADGRIMNGAEAVKLKLADEIGTTEDAYKLAAELAGLDEDNYEIFEPPKQRKTIFDILGGEEEEDAVTRIKSMFDSVMHSQLLNKPLYLMPGVLN